MEHNICRPVNNSDVSLGYQFCKNITFNTGEIDQIPKQFQLAADVDQVTQVKQILLLYLTLYIRYKIKVMFLQNWYPRETSLLFTGRQMLCLVDNHKVL
jgi:hypothetical protein